MTVVTTSRRSTTFTRGLARDLAFAIGSKYLPRGKHGFRELSDEHDLFIVIHQQDHCIIMTAYQGNNPVISRIILDHEEGMREKKIMRGVLTSDQKIKNMLSPYCLVTLVDSDEIFISFDGPQKRWMKLKLGEESVIVA